MEDEKLTKAGLADNVFRLLISDEKRGLELWREHLDLLRTDLLSDLPAVDVLACVYNAADYVSNSIESILLQSYPNLNLIIVDDGSTDGTSGILKQYAAKHPNMLLIENKENQGIVFSANLGLKHCSSGYIARMDLDDLIHPLRIEKQVKYLEDNKNTSAVSSWIKTFDGKGNSKEITYREDYDEQKITQLFFSPIAHAACTFRAEIIKELGYSDEFNDRGEDYHLFFRIMQNHKTAVLQESLYLYRTHAQQVTNPKHALILNDSTFRILGLIFDAMGLKHNAEDIRFHMQYLVNAETLPDKQTWERFDQWLQRLVNANASSLYFNHSKLVKFIRHNFWQTQFSKVKSLFNMSDFFHLLISNNYFARKWPIFKELLKSTFKSV